MKLSPKQTEALDLLGDAGTSGVSEFEAAWMLGKSRITTLKALRARGLARYFGTSERWRITPEGRVALATTDVG